MTKISSLRIRWLHSRDILNLAAMDQFSIDPWDANEIEATAKLRHIVTTVAECNTVPVGFAILALQKVKISVEKLTVSMSFRRNGVGRALIDDVKRRCISRGRRYFEIYVHDSLLESHQFLRACGVRAELVLDDHYRFVWRCPKQ